jgi:hypothetical protein
VLLVAVSVLLEAFSVLVVRGCESDFSCLESIYRL